MEPCSEGWEEGGVRRVAGPQGHISVLALEHSSLGENSLRAALPWILILGAQEAADFGSELSLLPLT